MKLAFSILSLLPITFWFSSIATATAQDSIEYNRDIKPILAENCFACHGIDADARQADLRLDDRSSALESGAIVPKDAEQSALVERVFTDDESTVMPPPESHKKLTESQKQLLQQWVAEGANYETHWSLTAPQKPASPQVKNEKWVRNDIDRFVLARLEKDGLEPEQDTDARTLFRRLCLDINGLPPSPADVSAFETDYQARGDQAVSDWIDRLMERSSWGEHRARYWLDAARYADTHGFHFDNYREIWPYRDWVIRSFNSNQPFDQFTVEQLAGDLLDSPTKEQLIATGFQRCNMTTNEGGTIDEENMAIYAADRVQTFGWVYLGLTTNCCQCHDHKFDPISMKDYYSLAAFFRNTTQKAKDGNVKDGTGPVIVVPSTEDTPRWNALPGEITTAKKALSDRKVAAKEDFENWLAKVDVDTLGSLPTDGMLLHLPMNDGEGNEVKRSGKGNEKTVDTKIAFKSTGDLKWETDGVIGPAARLTKGSSIELGEIGNFPTEQPRSVGCWVKTTAKGSGAIIGRMDNNKDYRGWDVWQDNGEFASHIIDKWTENGLKVITKGNQVKPGTWQHVMVTWDGSGKSTGLKIFVDGNPTELNIATDTLKEGADSKIETQLRIGQRSTGQYPFEGFVQDFVLYERKLEPTEIANIAQQAPLRFAIKTSKEDRTDSLNDTLLNHYLLNQDSQYVALFEKVNGLKTEREQIKTRSPVTHVQVEKETPAMANLLMRGAYDKVGDEVTAAPPAALHPMPKDAPANRLGLAQWVIDPNNPVTARVTVNRFWQELFGHGIVATSEDFGVMGTPPANQDLLDWLAVDFRESNWDVKRFYKMMLMSSTYRQAAITTEEKLLKDRDNSLLSRGPRFRMDAEMVRDYALAASGLMTEKLYGPGTRPYQPENMWEIVGLPGGDTREYVQDKGEGVYRRSVYSFWKRMSPPPNLEAFNAPKREVCTVRRERTNTPLQALVTLNDPQFFEAARVLAQNAMKVGDGDNEQTLEFIAMKTVCRTLQQNELNIVDESYQTFLKHYQEHEDDAKKLIAFGQAPVDESINAVELATWTMVCNQMLNLDEVLCK